MIDYNGLALTEKSKGVLRIQNLGGLTGATTANTVINLMSKSINFFNLDTFSLINYLQIEDKLCTGNLSRLGVKLNKFGTFDTL